MTRSLVVGNGNLVINFDMDYNIRDIYYPYTGMENHARDCISRSGIWVDEKFAWFNSSEWQTEMSYDSDSLITHVIVTNSVLGLTLTINDLVDVDTDLFIRRVIIANKRDHPRDIRLFFHYELQILGNKIGDTIYYHPQLSALVMYKEHRYFLAGGQVNGRFGIDDWTTGNGGVEDKLSAQRDAEDGQLGKLPLACGFAEGIIGLRDGAVPAKGKSIIYHWLAASTQFSGIEYLHGLAKKKGPESFIIGTGNYWRSWANRESLEFADLPFSIQNLYRQSLFLIRVQIDKRGAIIASTDSDIINVLKDTYSNVWTRDGVFAARALDLANYYEVSQQFFEFCTRIITSDGYFFQKYNPDGSLAGQWLPCANGQGKLQLPIQEDETALVLWSLWHHYDRFHNIEFVRSHFQRLVKSAADFMVNYRESHTNLPAPSYDIWEERRGIHSFTVATVWAGLQAAANLSEILGEMRLTEHYREAATEIKEATLKYLFDKKLGRFLRSISVDDDGVIKPDYIVDSSICGLFLLGMLSSRDPLIESTMEALIDRLWCKTKLGGMARYEGDTYCQVSQDINNVPGNPWLVCTLWIADYHISRAQSLNDLKPARDILHWIERCSLSSGILAEQVHPYTCAPLNVSPLTWSHAALVTTIHGYVNKYFELRA